MESKDHYCGIVLMLFGGWIAWEASSFPALAGMPYGPGLFPTIAALGMSICGVLILFTSLIKRRKSTEPLDQKPPAGGKAGRPLFNSLAVILMVVLYALFLNTLGFHVISFFMLTVLFIVLQVHWITTIILAVGVTVGVHFIFYSVLHVPLPWGLMERFAW
jgi:putative tricarboxylic transport membrane protein